MTTMSIMSNRSILQLPIEVFHLIFDYLDCRTIVMKFCRVSQEMHDIVNSYNRLKINFSTFSHSHLQILSQSIQPQNVIAISLSIDYHFMHELDENDLLLSLFKINEFIRLKSLNLIRFDETSFRRLFEHIHKDSLKSLSIIHPNQSEDEIHRIIELCSSTILPYGLEHMDLHLSRWTTINIDILEPIKHVLRSLTINECTYEQYHQILSSYVNLKTFFIQNYTWGKNFSTALLSLVQSNYPRLRSLTINSGSLMFKQLSSMLSITPLLVHLQINLQSLENDCNLNGADWEEFLRKKLIHLKNFQFYFLWNMETIDCRRSLYSIIEPFKSPFWLTEKRWNVVCDFVLKTSDIILYTLPLSIEQKNIVVRCSALSLNDNSYLMAGHNVNHSNHLSPQQGCHILFLSCLRIHLDDTRARFLANALEKDTVLGTFICDNHSMSIEGICYIANAIAKNQTLQQFTLRCQMHRSKELPSIINSSRTRRRDASDKIDQFEEEERNQKFINWIDSYDTRGDREAECIANALIINKTLEVLSFESNQITNGGANHLAQALKTNSTLIALYCQHNEIRDNGVEYFADALLTNTSLRTLDLSHNCITSSGIEYLSNILQMNRTLTKLVLQNNQIDSLGCQYLANMLFNNQTLHKLMLGNNSIGDRGAEHLAQALEINKTLKALNLANNNIQTSGAKHLAKALDKNRTLISLDIQGNSSIDGTNILNLINQSIDRNKELSNE